MSEAWLTTARQAALQAGEVLRRAFRAAGEVRYKGRRNPVTEADLAAEKLIVERIRREYPEHSILAEEGGAEGVGPTRWIIDPLDGTVNFSHGLPWFAVAIAVEHQGALEAAVIYAPQQRELYQARRGHGATRNGQPLSVSDTAELSDALLATGFCYERNEVVDNNVAEFRELVLECRDLRRFGSAALDAAHVAAGHLDGYWERHLSPWDLAAGILLIREAGGRVTDLEGGDDMLGRRQLLATNATSLHGRLLTRLQEVSR